MVDVNVYKKKSAYLPLQMKRPDYTTALQTVLHFATADLSMKKAVVVTDVCCGVGNVTKLFSEQVPVSKAILVDINENFLVQAKKTLSVPELIILHDDVLKASFFHEADIVFSIFAYHHILDEKKPLFVEKLRSALKSDGRLILAEIYFDNKESEKQYYENLYKTVPDTEKSFALKEFLDQTAHSVDFEHKVSKSFTEELFLSKNLKKVDEQKIWPATNGDNGMYVQVYTPL